MVFLVQARRKREEEEGKEEEGGTFLFFLSPWGSDPGPSRDSESFDPSQASLVSDLAGVCPDAGW